MANSSPWRPTRTGMPRWRGRILQLAGVDQRVTLREGPALQSLEALGECPAFDLIFIDADKPNNPHYLRWVLRYSRPGTLIIGDNVVRDGEVVNPQSADERVQGVRQFIEMMWAPSHG